MGTKKDLHSKRDLDTCLRNQADSNKAQFGSEPSEVEAPST